MWQPYLGSIILVVSVPDPRTHSIAHPFCFVDKNCPCHSDRYQVNKVNEYVYQGLMTEEEARNFVQGG